jgi:hypothetical protein
MKTLTPAEANELLATHPECMGWEKVTVGYFSAPAISSENTETEWQRRNRDWMDEHGLNCVGDYYIQDYDNGEYIEAQHFDPCNDERHTHMALEAFGMKNPRMWYHEGHGWSVMVMGTMSYKDRWTGHHKRFTVAAVTAMCSALLGEPCEVEG